ncbi:MAG TPA: mercury methylation corrinoid protein HgcA [Spirochaetia bacterium]|nr:mercury methylation corrinoid protein HgcA [Spirochaetales bacterium]HRY79189.1 mercury methylation corrinoid protein HgcA [Spirochaetia bacterium]HRZ88472.1 mercury methylation corrinoid protein HgcA [Spirochaetia bacterium]
MIDLARRAAGPAERQAGFAALRELQVPWVERYLIREGRTVPVVRTRLSLRDRRGTLKVRWGFGRGTYRVLPGLYAAGEPGPDSPVFVSANYKLSFDTLRSNLAGIDGWILVLDTKGVNVWCAAGKGTFGTGELVSRIAKTRLGALVRHRELVLPQLGATGVSAPEVARRAGWRVAWGPVRAEDIPAWLAAGRIKTEGMRTMTFTLRERLAVAPVELVHSWPLTVAGLALAALYGLPADGSWASRTLPAAVLLGGLAPVGALAFPALLPGLPGRAFSVKGAALGAAWGAACAALFGLPPSAAAAGVLVAAPVTAFLGMNFTGSSTFTCQTGALLEVEKGFWPMAASLAAGLALGVLTRAFGA